MCFAIAHSKTPHSNALTIWLYHPISTDLTTLIHSLFPILCVSPRFYFPPHDSFNSFSNVFIYWRLTVHIALYVCLLSAPVLFMNALNVHRRRWRNGISYIECESINYYNQPGNVTRKIYESANCYAIEIGCYNGSFFMLLSSRMEQQKFTCN